MVTLHADCRGNVILHILMISHNPMDLTLINFVHRYWSVWTAVHECTEPQSGHSSTDNGQFYSLCFMTTHMGHQYVGI